MRRYLPYAREGLAMLVLSLLVTFECETLFRRQIITGSFRNSLWNIGLVTPWTMFTGPQVNRGWMIVLAKGEDGTLVDLLTEKPPVWTPSGFAPQRYPNARWAKLYFGTLQTHYLLMYKHMALFYGKRWNREHPDRPLAYVQIIARWKPTMPMFNTIPYKNWIAGHAWLKPTTKETQP